VGISLTPIIVKPHSISGLRHLIDCMELAWGKPPWRLGLIFHVLPVFVAIGVLGRVARRAGNTLSFAMTRQVISFHYTLRDSQGRLLDASTGSEPVSYLEGAGQIIEGLEEQLGALGVGSKQRLGVPAVKAYGLHDASQVQRVNRALLPVEGELRVGDRFQAGEDRYAPVVTVVAIDGDEVTLDANHPLAGVDLTFDVEVIAVRPATPEEIAHGHAHGRDGQGEC
jgi:FKBP-type peptidyl-prolyl cis-trans isomerase SlyD